MYSENKYSIFPTLQTIINTDWQQDLHDLSSHLPLENLFTQDARDGVIITIWSRRVWSVCSSPVGGDSAGTFTVCFFCPEMPEDWIEDFLHARHELSDWAKKPGFYWLQGLKFRTHISPRLEQQRVYFTLHVIRKLQSSFFCGHESSLCVFLGSFYNLIVFRFPWGNIVKIQVFVEGTHSSKKKIKMNNGPSFQQNSLSAIIRDA